MKTIFLSLLLVLAPFMAHAQEQIEPLNIGDLEIWPVQDSTGAMAKELLPGLAQHPEYEQAFARGPLPAVNRVYYLPLKDRKILFDSGWGQDLKVHGNSLELLAANGVRPGDITDIALTHMDLDHIGGLLKDGEAVFPNAALWISKPEFEAWTGGKVVGRNEDLAKKVAEKYAGRIRLFEFGDEIFPGVTAIDASGHTPGHTAYEISSGADKMIIGGDFIHIGDIQLPLPELSSVYDMDQEKAAATRRNLLEKAANEKALLTGMHLIPMSSVIKREDGGFNMRMPR